LADKNGRENSDLQQLSYLTQPVESLPEFLSGLVQLLMEQGGVGWTALLCSAALYQAA
jgi:hypothetical protein